MKKLFLVTTSVLALTASAAFASEGQQDWSFMRNKPAEVKTEEVRVQPAKSGFYVRPEVGYSIPNSMTLGLENAPGQYVIAKHKKKDSISFGIGVGYHLMDNFRVDVNFSKLSGREWKIDENHKANGNTHTYMVRGTFDFDTNSSFKPFLSVGLGLAKNSVKDLKTKTNFAWDAGAGIAMSMNDRTTLELSYRYVDAGKMPNKLADDNKKVIDVSGKGNNFKFHNVMLGLRFDL